MLFSNADLKRLIIPLIFEHILAITVGMADTMMIAKAGEAAMSGVSLVNMLNDLMNQVLAALSTGGVIVTSHMLGAGKAEEARSSAKQLIVMACGVSLFLMIFMFFLRRPALSLFFGNIEADVMENAILYLIITAFSFPCMGLYNACAALFRAMGNTGVTFRVSLLVNLINVTGNAVCILGLHMGVAGVALPTLLARGTGGFLLYLSLKNKENVIYLSKEKFHFNLEVIKDILRIGIPSGLENGFFQLGKLMTVSFVSTFGTVQIAANGIANNLDSLGCLIGSPMILAMLTVAGRCAGAGDLKQVNHYVKKLLRITYLASGILNAVILLSLNWLLALYSVSAETAKLSYSLVMIHNGIAIILWPAAFVLPAALRACKDVRFVMVTISFSMWAFRVGLGYILGVILGLGAIGIWLAMLADWVFRAACFIGRYVRGKWKLKVKSEHERLDIT